MRRSVVTATALLISVFGALNALAVDPTATFTLPNPGARSMALGGAFVAQADDATAAIANPAGLVQLLDPEVSAELRFWLYSSDSEEGFGSPDSEVIDVSGVGFLSGVYPTGRLSLALYRNQLAKFEVDSGVDTWYGDIWNIRSFEIVTWGLASAYRVTEELSVGLGVAYNEGEAEILGGLGPVRTKTDQWSFNSGVLWKPTQSFNFGGFYREGADLKIETATSGDPASASPLAVPDVFGIGIAYRTSGGSLALLGEWDHVGYSGVDGAEVGNAVVVFDDADELHLGAEYAFLWAEPIIAIRVGTWYDPAHRWLVEGADRTRIGKGETHWSSGVGFRWTHFQLDFAFDVSDPVITMSVSGIVSF